MPRRTNASQLLGWAIFALILAGGPILNAIQSATGIPIPGYTLPVLIALLMLGNVVLAFLRNRQSRRPSDGFPLETGNTSTTNAPMPPFGQGGGGIPRFGSPPSRTPPPMTAPPPMSSNMPDVREPALGQRGLRGPRFEPVISPLMVTLAVVGVVVLLIGAAVFFIVP